MHVRRLVIAFGLFVSVQASARSPSPAEALEFDNPAPRPTPRLESRQRAPRAKNPAEAERLELVLPSFVVHGIQPEKGAASSMGRKLDANGDAVVTPGAGLQYVSRGGFLALGAVLKDCYDNLAGAVQVGESFRLGRSTSWALSVGVYARETPLSCQTTMATYQTGRGRTQTITTGTSCSAMDSYPWKMMTTVNGESVDIIPMPLLHFTTALYKDSDVEIDFKFMGNFVLNEFGFAVPF